MLRLPEPVSREYPSVPELPPKPLRVPELRVPELLPKPLPPKLKKLPLNKQNGYFPDRSKERSFYIPDEKAPPARGRMYGIPEYLHSLLSRQFSMIACTISG